MELERELESQGVVSTESAVTVISEAAVLMEAGTGTVIYEKNQDVRVSPASITKIMTLLLIYDALYNGKIQLTDEPPPDASCSTPFWISPIRSKKIV